MTLERKPLRITSADKHPRESIISIGAIQMPVKDAIAALVFAATIWGSISMIPSAPSATEIPKKEDASPHDIDAIKKACNGRLVSDGKGKFTCEPAQQQLPPQRKRGEQDYLKPMEIEQRPKNSRTVPA